MKSFIDLHQYIFTFVLIYSIIIDILILMILTPFHHGCLRNRFSDLLKRILMLFIYVLRAHLKLLYQLFSSSHFSRTPPPSTL